MVGMVQGEVHPIQQAVFPPFVMNIEKQCTELSPCKEFYGLAEKLRHTLGILSLSILQGYPYADVEEMGTSFIAVGDGSSEKTAAILQELSQHLWENREAFEGTGIPLEEALASIKNESPRTCLLDMGDNVGGRSPADGTLIAHGLFKHQISQSFVCLYDPESVDRVKHSGIGSGLILEMGGKTDDLHGSPLSVEVKVEGLYDGIFHEKQPRHGGAINFDQGDTAVVSCKSGLTVMLTSKRMVPFSLEQLRSCGLVPEVFRVLVAKGVNSPLAAYEEVCARFIRVDTLGVTASNLNHFAYQHRRNQMFPFERDLE